MVLYWEDENAVRQVVSVDVETHDIRFLTHHPTPVIGLGVSRHGDMIFAALTGDSRPRSREMLERGFAVKNRDLYSLVSGDVAEISLFDRSASSEYFVLDAGESTAQRIAAPDDGVNRILTRVTPLFSPDGRWAVVVRTAGEVPQAWSEYRLGPGWATSVRTHAVDPRSPHARGITQYYLVDVRGAHMRPLWNAPLYGGRHRLAWSSDSKSLLIGPCPLPLPQTDAEVLSGSAVAEVEVATGRYRRLPLKAELAKKITALRWLTNSEAEVELKGGSVQRFHLANEVWRADRSRAVAAAAREAAVTIALRQDMNTPPAFYALDRATGREQLALDPNPQLPKFKLGRVEMIHWRDRRDQAWTGRLYYPVDYAAGHRYPLVVQTYGAPPATEFTLGGNRPGLGPVHATRLAQPLANRGVMVLQLGGPDDFGIGAESAAELAMQAEGREDGIDSLAGKGMVERHRVGIEGFSYTGRQLEYSLAFADFPYAAAIINDQGNNNYFAATSFMHSAMSFPGLVPFGPAGLAGFLENSPAWNAERIRTPVQLIVNGPGPGVFLENWELFARLRFLDKPVEMYVAPNMEQGNHTLQNPRQSMAVQQRGLDWWCFWLKREEDPDAQKVEQYEEWRILRTLHEADLKKPRPPMLAWKATPKDSAPVDRE